MLVAETDPALRAHLHVWLARNVGLLEKGRALLTERAVGDECERAFLGGLVAWMDDVSEDARAIETGPTVPT